MMSGQTAYSVAARERLIDRRNCEWPEVAIIGERMSAVTLACALRRGGITTATYLISPSRQFKRAIADDVDFILFADTLKMRDRTGCEWMLDPSDPVAGALFAANCGYLPTASALNNESACLPSQFSLYGS